MLEHLEYWLKYNADGPWWCYVMMVVGVVALGVVLGTLIREWLS